MSVLTDAGHTLAGATDADLLAWREAVVDGDLPQPWRSDRWQVLRAGVANLWEFEQAEYWYADGWVQLTGRNETGKSSLMALTTLIPWLADTSPANIDTLGDHGKRFRYYVEPTALDGDRRDASTSTSRGWLWVEYARLGAAGEPEFFTTMGYAEARRASATLTLRWCTSVGRLRVRGGLDLVVGRAVRTPADLAAAVAPSAPRADKPGGFEIHPTAAAYRAFVAEKLLGTTVERLESVGKMLRVARTPKLGQALNSAFVTDKLRDALPGLERGEVDALAVGWDQLDRVRRDLETAHANVQAVRAFTMLGWLPYARARLRQSADAAAAARTVFDGVARRVRESTDLLARAEAAVREFTGRIETATAAAAAAEEARAALVASTAYADAAGRVQQVEQATKDADDRRQQARAAASRAETAGHEVGRWAADLARYTTEAAERAEALARAVIAVRESLTSTGLADVGAWADPFDWARLDRLTQARRTALKQLDRLVRHFTVEDIRACRLEDQAVTRRSSARAATERAENAWAEAEHLRETIAGDLSAWIARLDPAITAEAASLDRWVAGLPVASGATVTLREVVRADWFAGPHDRATARAARAEHDATAVAATRDRALADIETLRRAEAPVVPSPELWRRRERPAAGPAGAPLWSLLDPKPGVDSGVLARVEAALAAMGLLDAWVTPGAVHVPDRDGAETVLDVARDIINRRPDSSAVSEGASLVAILTAADAAGPLARAATAALEAVGWAGDSIMSSPAPYAISSLGEWRSPLLAGRSAPVHESAALIGDAARRAARERLIASLQSRVDELGREVDRLTTVAAEARDLISRLAAAFALLPSDEPLRKLLAVAADRDADAADQQSFAIVAEVEAARQRALADAERATVHEYAAEYRLPIAEADRTGLADGLATMALAITKARAASDVHGSAVMRVSETTARRTAAVDVQAREDEAARTATGDAERAAATAVLLRASLDDDAQAVLAEAESLREARDRHQREVGGIRLEFNSAIEARGVSAANLDGAERDRAQAQVQRDASFEAFRALLDAGLAAQALIDLPDANARTIEATRDQVAVVRAEVTLPGWPSEPSEQPSAVARAVQRLTGRMDALRASLEAGGRTARLDPGTDPVQVRIVVDASGTAYGPIDAMAQLEETHRRLAAAYDESVQATLQELLGSAFIEHLRDRLTEMYRLVADINVVLARHPTGTTRTSLRIQLTPTAGASRAVLHALQEGRALLDPEVTAQVREFLRTRIEGAREVSQAEGDVQWQVQLAEALDYRLWFDVTLEKKSGDGGRWTVLTPATYAHLSGGARVVMLMLPFVATLTALYQSMGGAPRPFWLDEAFDGLDGPNRATVLELFSEFDLDVLVAGPGRLLNARTVSAAAIYQVVRAEDPLPGADLTVELWAGGELTPLERSAESSGLLDESGGAANLFGSPQ